MPISIEGGFLFFASVVVSIFFSILTNMLISIYYLHRERTHDLETSCLCPDQKKSAERTYLKDLQSTRDIVWSIAIILFVLYILLFAMAAIMVSETKPGENSAGGLTILVNNTQIIDDRPTNITIINENHCSFFTVKELTGNYQRNSPEP